MKAKFIYEAFERKSAEQNRDIMLSPHLNKIETLEDLYSAKEKDLNIPAWKIEEILLKNQEINYFTYENDKLFINVHSNFGGYGMAGFAMIFNKETKKLSLFKNITSWRIEAYDQFQPYLKKGKKLQQQYRKIQKNTKWGNGAPLNFKTLTNELDNDTVYFSFYYIHQKIIRVNLETGEITQRGKNIRWDKI